MYIYVSKNNCFVIRFSCFRVRTGISSTPAGVGFSERSLTPALSTAMHASV